MEKNKEIKLVIITGDCLRHYWFADLLSKHFTVKGVVFEVKRLPVSKEVRCEFVENYFKDRDKAEKKYFRQDYKNFLSDSNVLKINSGKELNSKETFAWINNLDPDLIISFGSGIICDPILSCYENKMINIHLGLSPYYRGAGTNFWALANNEPECVGATIHLTSAKVDAGEVLAQVRPNINIKDNMHDIGFKIVISGGEAMVEVINKYYLKQIKAVPQNFFTTPQSRLYKRADCGEADIKKMLKNFKEGMIKKYLADKKKRDSKYPIINL